MQNIYDNLFIMRSRSESRNSKLVSNSILFFIYPLYSQCDIINLKEWKGVYLFSYKLR